MKRLTVIVLVIAAIGWVGWRVKQSPVPPSVKKNTTKQSTASFNKQQFSTDTPGSLWWVVNKKRPLPEGYVPSELVVPKVSLRLAGSAEQMQLNKVTANATEAMFAAAQQQGIKLMLASGYRSEAYQRQLYNGYVATDGQEAADRSSAKPGTSEHQTGYAMDVCAAGSNCELVQSFGATDTGKWLAQHANEYGFVIRYQQGKESVTGYEYEPWHLRYVGSDLANELYKNGQTIEEFFDLKG